MRTCNHEGNAVSRLQSIVSTVRRRQSVCFCSFFFFFHKKTSFIARAGSDGPDNLVHLRSLILLTESLDGDKFTYMSPD